MLSQQLIAGAARSDRKSQEEIFRLCQPLVKTWCVRYLTNGEDAEECLMNCFFKFFSSLKSFSYQSEKETLAFIKKIAINECLMKLRKSALFPLERIIVEQDQETNDDIFDQLEVAEIFKQILKLPIGYRTVFNLYEIEGSFTYYNNIEGKRRTYSNAFAGINYESIEREKMKFKKPVQLIIPSITVGYLARRQGQFFDNNTFQLGLTRLNLYYNLLTIEPMFFISKNNFDPSIKLTVSFF